MTILPDTHALDLDLTEGWLTIWFNQPESRNAFTKALVSDLLSVLTAIRDDRSVRGVTLRGRGGIFCAGGDLKAFKADFQSGEPVHDDVYKMSVEAAQIFEHVNTLPQVVIALIEGAAMAGGFGLACCADVVIAQSDAKFAMTETMIGLSPAQISPFVIQKLGYATARRLMLTSARFNGQKAKDLGFADFTAENVDDLNAIERGIRAQVLRCAPGAIADTKALILALPNLSRDETVHMAATNFATRMTSQEAREGLSSFFEKRRPKWAAKPEVST